MELIVGAIKICCVGFCLGVGFWASKKLTNQFDKWLGTLTAEDVRNITQAFRKEYGAL